MRGFFSMFGKKNAKKSDIRRPIFIENNLPMPNKIQTGLSVGDWVYADENYCKRANNPSKPYRAISIRAKFLPNMKKAPEYATEGSAGADLFSALDRPFTLFPGCKARIPTGVAIELPPGYEAQIRPKSGLADKNGITVLNSPGTIDQDYRGEIAVIMINHNHSEKFIIYPGMKIAQLVLSPVFQANFVQASDLGGTQRGDGGFGSTGV